MITGITSGIGLYLLKLISDEDYSVIGTYRNLKNLDSSLVNHHQIHLIQMDIAVESSIESAFVEIESITAVHGLYALINNAGIAVAGPISHLAFSKINHQLQVNVLGPIKVIQMAFVLLRKYGDGCRIINISSVSGLFASPFLGAYAASKFALEGLSDSLRRELQLMNIKVILIEPGPIKTNIWKKNLEIGKEFLESPYGIYFEKARDTILEIERNALPVEYLKKPVLHALSSSKPKTRYLLHKNKILFYIITKLLPVPLVDYLVIRNLKSSKRKIRPI